MSGNCKEQVHAGKTLANKSNPCFFHELLEYTSVGMKLFRLLYSILSQFPRRVVGTAAGSFILFHFVSFAR